MRLSLQASKGPLAMGPPAVHLTEMQHLTTSSISLACSLACQASELPQEHEP